MLAFFEDPVLVTRQRGPNDSSWNRGKFINWYSLQCGGAACNATDNNGNLRKQETSIPNNEQNTSSTSWYQQYDYDNLNRLKRVHEYTGNPVVDWQQEYVYDRYGNRTVHQTNTWGSAINKKDFTANVANNNRLGVPGGQTGTMTYDPAGNLTTDSYSQATYAGSGSRVYDAENRMTSAQDANGAWSYYTYNADGQRVRRKVSGVETWQVYGFGGELLAEYAANASYTTPQKEYGYRNGQLLITADVTTGPPVPTFSDDFNDNSLDPAKWSVVDPNSPAVVSETGQRLQITLPANTATYNGIYSNATFDLTGKSVQVEVAQTVSQACWCENFMEAVLDANNYYLISVSSGSLVFRSMVGGVNNQTIIGYDPSAFPYWRIRHDQAANTINLETSSNGTAWTTRKTVTAGFSLTALRFYLYAGAWGTGNGSPGAAKYDNFQLVGNTPSTVVNLQWLVTDQLGTPRMVFDKTGALVTVKRHDYLPFGEELYANQGGRTTTQGYPASPNSNDGVRQKFTQKERDNETGLDYFGARYYASTQGRFASTDPYNIVREAQITAQSDPDKAAVQLAKYLSSPQQWNRYAYVANNPLKYIDPTGEYLELTGDSQADRDEALQRLKIMVGKDAATHLHVVEAVDSNNKTHYYVESDKNLGQVGGGKLGGYISEIIDSNHGVEYKIADSFTTQVGTYTTAGSHCGGACTVGAEESLNGNTQIFVNKNSDIIASGALHTPLNIGNFTGPNFKVTEDMVDAHEFGHAYANAIEGKKLYYSDETFGRAVEFENLQRDTYPWPERRKKEK